MFAKTHPIKEAQDALKAAGIKTRRQAPSRGPQAIGSPFYYLTAGPVRIYLQSMRRGFIVTYAPRGKREVLVDGAKTTKKLVRVVQEAQLVAKAAGGREIARVGRGGGR